MNGLLFLTVKMNKYNLGPGGGASTNRREPVHPSQWATRRENVRLTFCNRTSKRKISHRMGEPWDKNLISFIKTTQMNNLTRTFSGRVNVLTGGQGSGGAAALPPGRRFGDRHRAGKAWHIDFSRPRGSASPSGSALGSSSGSGWSGGNASPAMKPHLATLCAVLTHYDEALQGNHVITAKCLKPVSIPIYLSHWQCWVQLL